MRSVLPIGLKRQHTPAGGELARRFQNQQTKKQKERNALILKNELEESKSEEEYKKQRKQERRANQALGVLRVHCGAAERRGGAQGVPHNRAYYRHILIRSQIPDLLDKSHHLVGTISTRGVRAAQTCRHAATIRRTAAHNWPALADTNQLACTAQHRRYEARARVRAAPSRSCLIWTHAQMG